MKSLTTSLSIALIALISFSSCNSSLRIEKRRYSKGYAIIKTKKNIKAPKQSIEVEEISNDTKDNIAFIEKSKNEKSIEINSTPTPVTKTDNTIENKSKEISTTDSNLVLTANNSTEKVEKSPSKLETLKAFKQLKKDVKNTDSKSLSGGDVPLILLVILAILLPPLAVYLVRDISTEFWISLVLTLLFWLPGIVYAFLIVFDVI